MSYESDPGRRKQTRRESLVSQSLQLTELQTAFSLELELMGTIGRAVDQLHESEQRMVRTNCLHVRVGRLWQIGRAQQAQLPRAQVYFGQYSRFATEHGNIIYRPVPVSEVLGDSAMPMDGFTIDDASRVEEMVRQLEDMREFGVLPSLSPDCLLIFNAHGAETTGWLPEDIIGAAWGDESQT